MTPHSKLPFDRLENRVEVGEFARLQFGINFLPMDADFEGATTGGDELQRTDSLLKR